MTPEGYEKSLVKKYLSQIGAYQFWPVQTGYGAATIDCLACINGRFIGIEVKREGYQPASFTVRQRDTLNRIYASGGSVFTGTGEEIVKGIASWILKSVPAAG